MPQVQVRLRPDATSSLRFDQRPGPTGLVATLMKGTKVGEVYQDQKSFDVVVIGVPSLRADVDALCRLNIDLPAGGHVPLGDVADVEIVAGR